MDDRYPYSGPCIEGRNICRDNDSKTNPYVSIESSYTNGRGEFSDHVISSFFIISIKPCHTTRAIGRIFSTNSSSRLNVIDVYPMTLESKHGLMKNHRCFAVTAGICSAITDTRYFIRTCFILSDPIISDSQ